MVKLKLARQVEKLVIGFLLRGHLSAIQYFPLVIHPFCSIPSPRRPLVFHSQFSWWPCFLRIRTSEILLFPPYLMLGKTEGKRRKEVAAVERWIPSLTRWDLSKFWKTAKDRDAWCAVVHGVAESDTEASFYPLFLAPSFLTFFIPLPFQIHPYSNLQQSLKELTIFLAHNFTFLAWICCTWAFFFDTFSYTPLLRKLLLSESTDVTAKPVLVHPWLSFSSCNRMTDSWFSHVS